MFFEKNLIFDDTGAMRAYEEGGNAVLNPLTPCTPVTFDAMLCAGCNRCVDVCRMDVFIPNPKSGKPPLVLYPDECWFCGCCVEDCPAGAAEFHHPLGQRIPGKRKETDEM